MRNAFGLMLASVVAAVVIAGVWFWTSSPRADAAPPQTIAARKAEPLPPAAAARAAKDDVQVTASLTVKPSAAPAPFFRFPQLQHNPAGMAYLGTRNVAMFSTDLDSFDFRSNNPEQIITTVMTKVDKLGKGIILMHDFQKNTAEALPALLRRLKAGGYKVVQMKAKTPFDTLPEYDAMMVKDQKLPVISSRPVSSVVQTVTD